MFSAANDRDNDRYGNAAGWRWPVVHPFLVALFPILATYASGMSHIDPKELILPIAIALPATGVVTFLLCWLLDSRERGGLAASWTILLFYAYEPIVGINNYLAAARVPLTLPLSWTLPLIIALMLGGIYLLKRAGDEREADDNYTLAGNLAGLMALGVPLFTIGSALVNTYWPSEPVSEPPPYVQPAMTLTVPTDAPDIYYLVFHQYPDAGTLSQQLQFSNANFLQRLRRRGFIVADQSRVIEGDERSVLAATLNLYPPDLLPRSALEQNDMLAEPEVARILRGGGYRYLHLGSHIDGLRWSRLADENYEFSPLPTEFSETLVQLTIAAPWYQATGARTQIAQKVERVKVVADEQGKKLVFAHFLLPCAPYRFDRDGSPLPASTMNSRAASENYLNQLLYANSLIERMVDTILLKSAKKPVIVIQSDAGLPLSLCRDKEKEAALSERGVLTAIYFPKRERRPHIPKNLSPANTFRFLLRELFGLPIELLPGQAAVSRHAPLLSARLSD